MGDVGSMPIDGRRRVSIEGITPQIDCGRFPIKRILGERVRVEVDLFTDGHDRPAGVVRYRPGEEPWREIPLVPLVNDRWAAEFTVDRLGSWYLLRRGLVDRFGTWSADLMKRLDAGQDVSLDLTIGAKVDRERGFPARGESRTQLHTFAVGIEEGNVLRSRSTPRLALRPGPPRHATRTRPARGHGRSPPHLYASWYELFPPVPRLTRSRGARDAARREARLPTSPGSASTSSTCRRSIPSARQPQGPEQPPQAGPGDPGSPWAIGAGRGWPHRDPSRARHARGLRRSWSPAREATGIEIALDLALQCVARPSVGDASIRSGSATGPTARSGTPRTRPSGTRTSTRSTSRREDWRGAVGRRCSSVVRFWIDHGVRIFRVDNPHTKPFAFWEWLHRRVKRDNPECMFLAEAFTRPKVMDALAKIGFTQSYTYFTWRNTRPELREYFDELTQTDGRRLLPAQLVAQHAGHPARAAAGRAGGCAFGAPSSAGAHAVGELRHLRPAFELGSATPREAGSEEYLDSEKYEVRHWDLDRPDSLRDLIARRQPDPARAHRALQQRHLRFHGIDNDQLLLV